MIFLWMVIGVIVTSAAFFISPASVELWPSLNAAGIVATLYLVALLFYTLRHPIPLKQRIIVGVLSLVCLVALFFHWTGTERTTLWQQQRLQDIHSVIARGIIEGECPQKLLPVLEKYYAQGKGKKATLGQLLRQIYPDVRVGSNIHTIYDVSDSARCFVTEISDSLIIITASHAYAKGRVADFVPYWGRTGSIQEKYILTVKGVSHESDN
jgi:hypothetical protein